MKSFLLVLRPYQWIKNLLIFAPLLASSNFELANFIVLFYNFILFSLVVSSTYIINDLKDIKSDSVHPEKKNRPIASGKISKKNAKAYSVIIMVFVFLLYYFFFPSNIIFPIAYVFITLLYSFSFKYKKYLDFLSIVSLFILRVLYGGFILDIYISNYLIIFIFFFSFNIVISKKYSIYSDDKIRESEVKKFLKNIYTNKELISLFYVTSFFSMLTYTLWSFSEKILPNNSSNSSIFFVFSLISFYFLIFELNYLTKKYLTEDIIFTVVRNKKLFFYLVLYFTTFISGIYYEV
jgi:decaprenyl-phosphate phosphoribosyltransferase